MTTRHKTEISFRVIGDSGPLSLYFQPGPYGDAVEAKNGTGVSFFSQSGSLLAVEFDDVSKGHDRQKLEFDRYRIIVKVTKGHVSYQVDEFKNRSTKKLVA